MSIRKFLFIIAGLASVSMLAPVAYSQDDNVSLGKELTTLFRSARGVISTNQSLINDANKGNKGLTGVKVVEMATKNYKNATWHELVLDDSSTGQAKKAMLDAVTEVMDEAQELINQEGTGFKGFLPAIFAKEVASKFSSKMSGKMKIKLTAPKSYLRNHANRPDKWENNVIEAKFKSDKYETGEPFFELADVKGKMAFRYILPEYYTESCLGCHGSPKGELDITGGKKEGGTLGELGGAISLIVY